MTPRIVVVGGGYSGCAAAVEAANLGAEVHLIERTDLLLGVGNHAGNMRCNASFTLEFEAKAMGAAEMFLALEELTLHPRVEWLDNKNSYFYDCLKSEPRIRRLVLDKGVSIHFEHAVDDVVKKENRVEKLHLASGEIIAGDCFVDATGTAGGIESCVRNGKGCVECIYRCNSYGDPIRLSTLFGATSVPMVRANGKRGGMTAAFTLYKETLAPDLISRIEREGVVLLPIPEAAIDYGKVNYSTGFPKNRTQAEFLVLGDVGHAKCFGGVFFPLSTLRRIPGLENARIEHPLGGGVGNAIRFADIALCDDSLRVDGAANLFCAGERIGFSGVPESIASGTLAGYNAMRITADLSPLVLPKSTVLGLLISVVNRQKRAQRSISGTIGGGDRGEGFKAVNEAGLYTTDVDAIRQRVLQAGFGDIFKSLVK